NLQRMARMEERGEAVGGRENSVLRSDAREGFEGALGPIAEERVAGEGVEAFEDDGGDGICAGSGRILKILAAHVEAADGRRVGGAVEEAAILRVTIFFDGDTHGEFGDGEVFAVERGFVRVKERGGHENLIVEQAGDFFAAEAMPETGALVPGFGEDAVESFQREGAAICPVKNARGFEERGSEHGVPTDVDGAVDGGSLSASARGEHFAFGASDEEFRVVGA